MSYYIGQKVSHVSQNARVRRDTPARGARRARSVPSCRPKRNVPKCRVLDQAKVLGGVVDAIVVYGGRYVGRSGLDGLLRVAHGHACAHDRKH